MKSRVFSAQKRRNSFCDSAPLLRGVTESCIAGIRSHCPDKVDDIQAVRKSSTDQCNILVNFCFLRISENDISFSTPRNSDTLNCQLFRESDHEWHSRSGEMSLFDKSILGVCLLHTVFLSDVLGDVVVVTSKYSALMLYPTAKAILPRLTTCLF